MAAKLFCLAEELNLRGTKKDDWSSSPEEIQALEPKLAHVFWLIWDHFKGDFEQLKLRGRVPGLAE